MSQYYTVLQLGSLVYINGISRQRAYDECFEGLSVYVLSIRYTVHLEYVRTVCVSNYEEGICNTYNSE
jgi:hypothetical protein